MDNLGASFEALIRADSEDPKLPAARASFVNALAKGFRGPLFESRKTSLVGAAVRCGPALAERVTREALHAVAEVSATQPGSLARPIAALVLQAAREAHSEPDAGCGHGGFTDPLIGEQLADFLPQHLGSLDPRVVLEVIKYLAPLVKAFAPPSAMSAVHAAASPVVSACLSTEPPALAVACALVANLDLDSEVWPREELLELCMEHDQWAVAEALVTNCAAAATAREALGVTTSESMERKVGVSTGASMSRSKDNLNAIDDGNNNDDSDDSIGDDGIDSDDMDSAKSAHNSNGNGGRVSEHSLGELLVRGALARGRFKQATRYAETCHGATHLRSLALHAQSMAEIQRLAGRGEWRLAANLCGDEDTGVPEASTSGSVSCSSGGGSSSINSSSSTSSGGAARHVNYEGSVDDVLAGRSLRSELRLVLERLGQWAARVELEALWSGEGSAAHRQAVQSAAAAAVSTANTSGASAAIRDGDSGSTNGEVIGAATGFLDLALPVENVLWVDSPTTLAEAAAVLLPPPSTAPLDPAWAIGIDVEWTSVYTSPSVSTAATVGREPRAAPPTAEAPHGSKRNSTCAPSYDLDEGFDSEEEVESDDEGGEYALRRASDQLGFDEQRRRLQNRAYAKRQRLETSAFNSSLDTSSSSCSSSSSNIGSSYSCRGSSSSNNSNSSSSTSITSDKPILKSEFRRNGSSKLSSMKQHAELLQVATARHVALFDLRVCCDMSEFDTFIDTLVGSGRQLVLGIGLSNDLQVLQKSYPRMTSFQRALPAVLDIVSALQSLEQQQNGKHNKLLRKQAASSGAAADFTSTDEQQVPHALQQQAQPMGLSAACRRWLGAPLNKAQQCSDWSARPLSLEQAAYAANDAHGLVRLFAVYQTQRGVGGTSSTTAGSASDI